MGKGKRTEQHQLCNSTYLLRSPDQKEVEEAAFFITISETFMFVGNLNHSSMC